MRAKLFFYFHSFWIISVLTNQLVKALNSQDNSTELQFMERIYADDVNAGMLNVQLETAAEGR